MLGTAAEEWLDASVKDPDPRKAGQPGRGEPPQFEVEAIAAPGEIPEQHGASAYRVCDLMRRNTRTRELHCQRKKQAQSEAEGKNLCDADVAHMAAL